MYIYSTWIQTFSLSRLIVFLIDLLTTMRPKLISISRRYFRLSSISSSTCIFQSRNASSANTNTSDNSSASKDLTFKSFLSPMFRSIKKSPNLFPSYSISTLNRLIRGQPINGSDLEWDEDGGPMTDFLTRFSWIMKVELFYAYPYIDREVINAMLLIIISELEKGGLAEMLDSPFDMPSQNFNQGFWKTVWEVSNSVFLDMLEEKKYFKKTPSSYVGGIRGGTLRKVILKWTIAEMQEFEATKAAGETVDDDEENVEEKLIPKVKYSIYGLDLSDPRFADIVDRIHEADKRITPGEPKEMTGKCKMVHDKILSLKTEEEEDLLTSLLTEWTEILQPNKIDWLILLDNIKKRNLGLYCKMAEHVLDEDSFQANSRDYLKLMRAHTKANRLDDAERILRKMTDKGGTQPNILTSTILVQMYSKTFNVERAKAAVDDIMTGGFPPDYITNKSMIMTLLNATQRIDTKMQFLDMQTDLEPWALLVEAHGQAGDPEQAIRNIDNMIRLGYRRQAGVPEKARRTIDMILSLGYRPDDRCTSSMLAAYRNKNLLDKALSLFLDLKKSGIVTGAFAYTVRIDWYHELERVVDKELLRKVNEKGGTSPLKAM